MLSPAVYSILNYGRIERLIHINICDESGNVAKTAIKRLFDSDEDDFQDSVKKRQK